MNKWDSNNLSLDELPRLKNLSRSDLEDGNKRVYDSIVNSERGVGIHFPMVLFQGHLMLGCTLIMQWLSP